MPNDIELVQAEVERFYKAVEAEYGRAAMSLGAFGDFVNRALVLQGHVLNPRQLRNLRCALAKHIPIGWSLSTKAVGFRKGVEWRAASGVRLWREARLDPARRSLNTEITSEDGPLEVLESLGDLTLVRGVDGTFGWTEDRLGSSVPAPVLKPASSPRRGFASTLKCYVGVPYKSGGTTRAGIDCSGLIQRVYREVFGVIMPRHSEDQCSWVRPPARPLGLTGDLVFVGNGQDGNLHVGLVMRAGTKLWVVHASSSRGCVVRDDLERYLLSARSILYRTIEDVIETYNTHTSKPCLSGEFFPLVGNPPPATQVELLPPLGSRCRMT